MEHVENQFNGGLAAGGIFTYCVDKAVVDAVVDLFWSCTNAKMKDLEQEDCSGSEVELSGSRPHIFLANVWLLVVIAIPLSA